MLAVDGMTVTLNAREGTARKQVWDLPVRVTHALLIVCVAGAWLTREAPQADLHAVFGYCALGLVAFRICWGLFARGHARISSFAYSPAEAIRYVRDALRGAPRHYTGHNPAGSYAVFGLLALITAVTVSGVLALGGMHGDGPLAATLSHEGAELARVAHDWLAWAVLGFAVVHVAGVAWGSRVHRENLALAMITGSKAVHEETSIDAARHGGIATLLVALAAAFGSTYLLAIAPRDTREREARAAQAKAALASQPWGAECGSCHLAYPPATLPLRSWVRTFAEQQEHFGEDLGLGKAMIDKLMAHAASPASASWAEWRLASSALATEAPLRVSELPYWRHAHRRLPDPAFQAPTGAGRHDCEACHADAASGIFHPRMIHNPKAKVTP